MQGARRIIAHRLEARATIARRAEEVGLDVFASGEHHNPPFVPSSPTTMLGYLAAQTSRLILSTATTLITTNDPVKIAEDYAMLQHLADGRVDLMLGRGNTGPVYPWFGQDIRDGIPLAVENYALLRRLWREVRRSHGEITYADVSCGASGGAAGPATTAPASPSPLTSPAPSGPRMRLATEPRTPPAWNGPGSPTTASTIASAVVLAPLDNTCDRGMRPARCAARSLRSI